MEKTSILSCALNAQIECWIKKFLAHVVWLIYVWVSIITQNWFNFFIPVFIILILNETQSPAHPPHGLMTPPHTQISDLPKQYSRFLGCFVRTLHIVISKSKQCSVKKRLANFYLHKLKCNYKIALKCSSNYSNNNDKNKRKWFMHEISPKIRRQ